MRLRTQQAAEYLGTTASHLRHLRIAGGGPPYFRVSHSRVVYDRKDLDAWMAERRRTSTSDPGPRPRERARRAAQG